MNLCPNTGPKKSGKIEGPPKGNRQTHNSQGQHPWLSFAERKEQMEYRIIDLEHWKRREYFEHYRQAVPCIYSMTVQVDITNIRQKG